MEENEEIAKVYMMTRRQYITAEQGRVVDIDIQAVKTVMDMYGIQDQRKCLDTVRWMFHELRSGDAG